MRSSDLILHISMKRVLTTLLVTVVPLVVLGIYGLTRSQNAFHDAVGGYLTLLSEGIAAETAGMVNEAVRDVEDISIESTVIEAVIAANRNRDAMGPAAFEQEVKSTEAQWRKPEGGPFVARLLASPASQFLRRLAEKDGRFLQIIVTDKRGATVASIHKTGDFYHADETFWQDILAKGKGAASVADVEYDPASQAPYISIGAPIKDASSAGVLGTIYAHVRMDKLSESVFRPALGSTGRVVLAKKDGGAVIFARRDNLVDLKSGQTSHEFEAVRDATAPLPKRAGHVISSVRQGGSTSVIGFADVGLQQHYKNLNWVALVAQDADEAFAPFVPIGTVSALTSVLGVLGVIFVGVYFTTHRKRELEAIGQIS